MKREGASCFLAGYLIQGLLGLPLSLRQQNVGAASLPLSSEARPTEVSSKWVTWAMGLVHCPMVLTATNLRMRCPQQAYMGKSEEPRP